ncbi:PadR family transcriptional regulator [Nonomuraea sp. CA-143628]|uniref:PadR family transcriptional regulator n=1 Tax=Nonomuraea sp. CA-143628 TaxID=3239997 RepID=UPI003D92EDF8
MDEVGRATPCAAFDRLQEEGLIAEDREEIVDGRVRRYYRLTDDGATRLAAEAERMRRHARAAATRPPRLQEP